MSGIVFVLVVSAGLLSVDEGEKVAAVAEGVAEMARALTLVKTLPIRRLRAVILMFFVIGAPYICCPKRRAIVG
jgi:hypothetical protein